MNLQNKTALITGAAKRVGRQIALTLASRGVNIVVHYDRSRKEALALKKEIEDFDVSAYVVQASFSAKKKETMEKRVAELVRKVKQQVSHVDILVNNAAIFYPTPVGKVKQQDWDEYLAVNLSAPFFLSQALGVKMVKKKRGKIINLVDWTGLRPKERFVPYSASKAGLISITNGLAKALAPHVQVLSIAPGPILPVVGSTKKEQAIVKKQTLLKRYGCPEDIAQTVRFFCEDTDYITGVMIPVDGGASIL